MAVLMAASALAQTNLNFNAISVTDESAIRLSWSSISNEVYEIDEADALGTNADGSTAWNNLYDNYPSQGTNTFWLDTGNYNLSPQILHPKYMPMRFYRIVDLGPDTTSDEPTVTILSPTSGTAAVGELSITVLAITDQPVLSGTKLYVDGQEMPAADSTTNYTDITGVTNYEMDVYNINTCEWGNETHVLFATTECQSGYGDAVNSGPVTTGHGVSPFVPVLFSNLVTRISFSQPTFDPSSGQTQQVSAVFAANCNWTLNIVDINSNVVQTATGSGMSTLYNWDGTSNGTNIPNGTYFYYISAVTNGASSDVVSGGSGGGSPPSADFALSSSVGTEPSELWAIAPGSQTAVPLMLYPPGFDTNDFAIFSASPSQIQALSPSSSLRPNLAMNSSGSFSPDGASAPAAQPSQPAPAAPQRPPNNPVKGLAGTFGICYDTYTGNGTNGYTLAPLDNGLNLHQNISMDGYPPSTNMPAKSLRQYTAEANNFISIMQHWGWKNTLLKADNTLSINDLIGISSPLNNVNLAVFMAHGFYGTGGNGLDYSVQSHSFKQMYYPVTSGGTAKYLRLSQMNLGGSGTNGLKWAALLACNSLQHNNWANMQSQGILPYNTNLHLLLGVDTVDYTDPNLLWYWGQYMNYGTCTNGGACNPLTIRNAWYQAARKAYAGKHYAVTSMSFVVAGDSACFGDYIQTNNAPQGAWHTDDPQQVWP